jgi:hypothetical protein
MVEGVWGVESWAAGLGADRHGGLRAEDVSVLWLSVRCADVDASAFCKAVHRSTGPSGNTLTSFLK